MSLGSGSAAPYIASDQILVDQIVYELKSQGIFDSFRKECIADVDTKPAYQNLRQRVEGSVSSFLKDQKWNPESNKNQLREMLRKNIYESGFLETGVERIVSQVVNPKINTIFLPKVKEIFYKYIGLQTPTIIEKANTSIKVEVLPKTEATIEIHMEVKVEPKVEVEFSTQDLLPTDLEAVSPENDNIHDHDNNDANQDSNSMAIDDDDTSPPFEPIDEDLSFTLIPIEENSVDSHLSGMSGLLSHDSHHSNKDNTVVMQQLLESDSQVSKNSSSDDRLSIVTDDASNTKVDMLVVNDGVVIALETTQSSEDNDAIYENKVMHMEVVNDVSENTKDKVANDNLEGSKTIEDTTDLRRTEEVKDEIFDEDSKTALSSEISDGATKQNLIESISKHGTSKKSSSKDYKRDTSKHKNSSKSIEKSRDSKEYRESKEKASNSKVSRSSKDKDNKSKSSSSSSSNRHSSDKDKDRSVKKYSSSSSKDKSSISNMKNKSSSISSNDKDKNKDRDCSTSANKEKESSTSSRHKDSSNRDQSSSKSSTSSSRDKSSSKDHSKDSRSKNSSSSNKHRSSSSRKYSSSSTTRTDYSKSHTSSNSSKDKREKRDNSSKDDHFSSKAQRIERRSTDRDSNDGQTKNKGGATSNESILLVKSDEQTSNNNTTEDSSNSNSNSKDGSNSDCCQNQDDIKKVSYEQDVVNDENTEVIDNLQPVVASSFVADLEINKEGNMEKSLEVFEDKDVATDSLACSLTTQISTPALMESITRDVETLDAIKSHLAEYKLDGHSDNILHKIKLPKVASNFREARKIMKLRKRLKQQNKLRMLLSKENFTLSENAAQTIGEVANGEVSDDLQNNAAMNYSENTGDANEHSLLLLEHDLSNDGTSIPTEHMKNDDTVKIKPITNYNDDCLYCDKVTDETLHYLHYTDSFIETLDKEIRSRENKITVAVTKRKGQKRKFSTLSTDSSIYNDSTADQASSSSKVSRNTSPPLASQTCTENNSTAVRKSDVVLSPSGEDGAGVTSATAHVHVVKQRKLHNSKATQRYTSDDLYKPRPFLKGTTKRTSGRVAN